jgi:hypothetical protein
VRHWEAAVLDLERREKQRRGPLSRRRGRTRSRLRARGEGLPAQGARAKLRERRPAAGEEAPVSRTASPSAAALAPVFPSALPDLGERGSRGRRRGGRGRSEAGVRRGGREKGARRRVERGRGAAAGGARQGCDEEEGRRGQGDATARDSWYAARREKGQKKSRECSTPPLFAHCAEPSAASAGGEPLDLHFEDGDCVPTAAGDSY